MPRFDSQTTLSVIEGYDLTRQHHYVNRCEFFHKKCSFRIWQVILFLLMLAAIIIVMSLLIAMFGPGNTNLKYSKKEAIHAPTVAIDGGNEHTFTDVTPGKETVEPTEQQSTGTPKSTPTTPPREKTPLECGVAILGGGTAGLLLASTLLESKNETNVCIFEKENRLGGTILDHRFPEAPNVTVGLGKWNIYGANHVEREIPKYLSIQTDSWIRNIQRVESRGVYEEDFDSLKSKAFPTVSNRPPLNTTTIQQIAEDISFESENKLNKFSTAGSFLSNYLSPEGAELMEEIYGFEGGYMQTINPKSYTTYIGERVEQEKVMDNDERPTRGMSEIIDQLVLKVRSFNGNIYLKETVTSISKEGDKFVLLTTNFTVKANKTVLTVGPTALKKLTGDVIQSITNHNVFKSIVSVPAFSGAAVYPTAWWNDSVAAQKNNSLEPLQMFVSSSNCLGITMPYNGTGPGGTAVLHTVANNGECGDMWGNILKVSKDAVDREIKRALEYKFQRTISVEPLDTVYKYWEEGFWYLQKPGSSFNLTFISEWAKRPLPGNDVFLVGKAFYNFGGWLQDTIKSANIALKEGWNLKFPWLPH